MGDGSQLNSLGIYFLLIICSLLCSSSSTFSMDFKAEVFEALGSDRSIQDIELYSIAGISPADPQRDLGANALVQFVLIYVKGYGDEESIMSDIGM